MYMYMCWLLSVIWCEIAAVIVAVLLLLLFCFTVPRFRQVSTAIAGRLADRDVSRQATRPSVPLRPLDVERRLAAARLQPRSAQRGGRLSRHGARCSRDVTA